MKNRRKFFDYESAKELKSEAQFKRAWDRNSLDHTAVNDAMIAAGRGHWRNAETAAAAKTGDPLALASEALAAESNALGYRAESFFGQPPYMVHGKTRMIRKKNPRKRRRNPATGGNVNVLHFERWNRGGRHKWITKSIAAKLPRIGTTSELPPEKVRVALKLFNPGGAGSWFITEANLETGEAFGYVTGLGTDELGYMDLNEMRAFKGRFGLPLERDEHFSGTLAEVMDRKKNPRKRKLSDAERRQFFDDLATRERLAGPQSTKAEVDARNTAMLKWMRTKKNPRQRAKKSRRKNPDAYVIALYMGNKRLTYDAGVNRFSDHARPSLYGTAIAAQDRAQLLLKRNAKLTHYKVTVEKATAKEAGAVFGARPRQRNPRKRPKYGIGVSGNKLTIFTYDGIPTRKTHPQFGGVIGMFATRKAMEGALNAQRRGSNINYEVIDETRRPKK